jgi:hypothetical protein
MARTALTLNPSATRAFVANAATAQPATFRAFEQFCQANGHDSGSISRVRNAQLYSTVAISYSGAGVPTLTANRLYSQPLGATDATFGTLTDRETNLSAANKMPNGQSFLVREHGFDLFVHTGAAAATPDLITNALLEIANSLTAKLLTGSETTQIWGPIQNQMLGGYGVNATPAAAIATGFPQGGARNQGLSVEPMLALEPGQTFSVEVNSRGTLSTVANMAGVIIGVRHSFFGQTRTAVDG